MRNPDYWGKDIGFRRGTNNFDEIRLDFYADGSVQFEAFKAGESSSFRELNAERWENSYDFDAVQTGEDSQIYHSPPTPERHHWVCDEHPQAQVRRLARARSFDLGV